MKENKLFKASIIAIIATLFVHIAFVELSTLKLFYIGFIDGTINQFSFWVSLNYFTNEYERE